VGQLAVADQQAMALAARDQAAGQPRGETQGGKAIPAAQATMEQAETQAVLAIQAAQEVQAGYQ